MGVAGLIFEPHPSYFANQCIFLRCTNDVCMTFWYIYWFQIYKKPQRVICPGISVVHAIAQVVLEKIDEYRQKISTENPRVYIFFSITET